MKRLKRLFAFLLTALLVCSFFPVSALEAPYEGYTYDYFGRSVPAPVTYVPGKVYFGEDMGVESLKNASDLFVYNDRIYIADTDNNRVLELNSEFKVIHVYKDFVNKKGKASTLSEPRGVFVKENMLYITDSKNARVIGVELGTNVIKRSLYKPNSSLLSDNNEFIPDKVVVDAGDNVYVACVGYYYGLAAYSNEDRFTGFFGGNEVQLTLKMMADRFWKSIFSEEQRKSLTRAVPVEYSNIFIKGDFIYTSAKKTETSKNEIQKLNPLGIDILSPTSAVAYDNTNFGDIETGYYMSQTIDNSFVDIYVDENDLIAVLDEERCRVFLYDQECNFIGTFAGPGEQKGAVVNPSAIGKIGDSFLILDKGKNCITTYSKSEYISYIEEGLYYYSQGLYEESVKPWEKVLEFNSQYPLAYKSIGKAFLQEGEYEKAMDYFKKSEDKKGYSQAFREYRKTLYSKYFLWIILALVALVILIKKLINFILKKLGVEVRKTKISYS